MGKKGGKSGKYEMNNKKYKKVSKMLKSNNRLKGTISDTIRFVYNFAKIINPKIKMDKRKINIGVKEYFQSRG